VNFVFLALYVLLPAVALWRVRSTAWLVIGVAGTFGVFGSIIAFLSDRGHTFTRIELQWMLLVALTLLVVIAFIWPLKSGEGSFPRVGFRRQFLTAWLPFLILLLMLAVITTQFTPDFAFLRPVGYLIGHGTAEDNAKWLDYAAQWASGVPITQGVILGGPLQLALTFIGTFMAVISQVSLGGFNEVAVAANMVVYGQLLLAVFMPFVLAPLAESRFAKRTIPAPFIWVGSLVLVAASLVVISYGHLTLQFSFLIIGLWSAVFLSAIGIPRARLVASLAAAASMTVWLPLNGIAVVIILGWLFVFISHAFRNGVRQFDWIGLGLLVVVAVGIFEPIRSSMEYVFAIGATTASAALVGVAGGVAATVAVIHPGAAFGIFAGLADSGLFAATGGTDSVGPILALVAAVAAIGAAVFLAAIPSRIRHAHYLRFIPLGVLTIFALIIYTLDFWITGGGPNYGSMKFTFLATVVATATTLPIALMNIEPSAKSRMSAARWVGVGAVVIALSVVSLLPRAVANARPENWTPPIPFNNTSGSYWWPAEVNGKDEQPISAQPVACVYLPQGATAPSAIVPSGLSDAQRVYACSRQLAGLSGSDTTAQPLVDWLRREWLTNTPAWIDVWGYLDGMPNGVKDRNVILLDEGSNVIGLETVRSLLQRFPNTPS